MASFGARLKQEREQRGITLDDISLSTKIGTRMLRALEEEHFDQLPGGIFNKGFIRAYARTLGMDEEQVIAEYLAATGGPPPGQKPADILNDNDVGSVPELRAQLEQRAGEEAPGTSSFPWGRLAVALIVLAIGFAGWGFYSRQSQTGTYGPVISGSNGPSGEMADQSSPQQPPSSQPSTPQSPPQPQSQSQPPQSPPQRVENAASAPKADQTKVAIVTQSAPAPSAPAPSEPAATAPISTPASIQKPIPPSIPGSGTFVVSIEARQDSWISITVDGEVTTERTLNAASQKSVVAHHDVLLRAGNVGALDIAFNGKPLPSQGAVGEARTLTFNAHGLEFIPPRPEAPAPLP